MWPFNRKSKVIDRRDSVSWRAGEKAICVNGAWDTAGSHHPEVGDVLTVLSVHEATVRGVRAFRLGFKAIPGEAYESGGFRKLVDTDDAAMIQRIKSLSKVRERTDA